MAEATAIQGAERIRAARIILAVSLIVSVAVALVRALRDPRFVFVAALLAAGLGLLLWLADVAARHGIGPGWLIAVAVLNLLLVAPELALRAAGFRYESGIEFGYPPPSYFVDYQPNEKLFWTLRPGAKGVNSWGFLGREVTLPKPAGTRRIVVLGDSCSQAGYPFDLERRLQQSPDRAAEVVILAAAGYSSHQGRVLAETRIPSLQADVALVYYGWHDHWRAWGEPDESKHVAPAPSAIGRLHARLHFLSRLLGGIVWARDELYGVLQKQSGVLRVSPERYRENLDAIASTLEAAGTRVVFITAPTSYYRFGVPPYIEEAGLAVDAASAIALHRQYNDIVREVAAAHGAALLDLEQRFDALGAAELREIFAEDGIHFSPRGHLRVAAAVDGLLAQEGVL